jgi:hypothetical protein
MKLAGNRLRVCAAALLSMMTVLLMAPIVASAHDTDSRAAAGG